MSKKFKLKPVQQIINKQTGMSEKKSIINTNQVVYPEDWRNYIFIHIVVQDGERRHDHKIVFQTKCKNTVFAVMWYVCHYWGFSWLDKESLSVFAHGGEIALKVALFKRISKMEYEIFNKITSY